MARTKQQSNKGKKRKAVELEQKPARSQPIIQIEEEDFPRGGQELLSVEEKEKIKQAARDEFQAELSQAKKQKLVGYQRLWKVLNSSSFVTGVKIWGIVESVIPNKGLVVSLPCGIKGFAEIHQCSDVLARLLGSVQDEEAAKIKQFFTDIPSLNQLFYMGQYVRGVVLESSDSEHDAHLDEDEDQETPTGKQPQAYSPGRKVNLCLKVEEVNKGLSKLLLQAGMQLAACVRTIEEKGFTLTFGVKDTEGFLSVKSFREKFGPQASLIPGQILDVSVSKTVSKKKGSMLVKVECCPEASRTQVLSDFPGQTIYNMIPGVLVNAKITLIEPNGITVEFLKYFKGIIQYAHVGCTGNISASYKIGDMISGRIIYLNADDKDVRISMLSHIINYHSPPQPPSVGTFFKDITISHYLNDRAVFMKLKADNSKEELQGIITTFCMADDELSTQQRKQRFKPGEVIESVRVVSYRMFDGAVMLSSKKSDQEAVIMSTKNVDAGQFFRGITVTKVCEDGSLTLKLASNIIGRIRREFVFDNMSSEHVDIREVQKRFKANISKVDCQVLGIYGKGRVILTMKKPQIQSKLPLLTDLATVEIGKKYHGVVKKVLPYGLMVEFYNFITGIAPLKYLPLEPNQSVDEVYKPGQVLKCSVVSCYPQDKKITLSLVSKKKLSEVNSQQNYLDSEALVGQIVAGKVKEILVEEEDEAVQTKTFILDVVDENDDEYEGVLRQSHLTDHLCLEQQIADKIHVGSIISELLVMAVNNTKKQVYLSRKPSLIGNKDSIPRKFEDVKQYGCVMGYVGKVEDAAVYVRFLGRAGGRGQIHQLADFAIKHPQDMFQKGQTVRAFISATVEAGQKCHLCLKQKLVGCSKKQFLKSYFKDIEFSCSLDEDEDSQQMVQIVQQLKIGDYVQGKFHEEKPYGVLCDLNIHEDLVGLITTNHIPHEMPTDSDTTFKARILDLNFERGIVDLTLLPRLLHPSDHREDDLMPEDDANDEKTQSYEVANIELTKIEQGYIIVSTKHGKLMRCPIHDYNTQNIFQPQFDLFEQIRGNVNDSELDSDSDDPLFIVRDVSIVRKLGSEFTPKSEVTVGNKYSGKVLDIYGVRAIVGINSSSGRQQRCVLHASEIEDSDEPYLNSKDPNQIIFESSAFKNKFGVGDIIQVVCLRQFRSMNYFNLDVKQNQFICEVSMRPSVLSQEISSPKLEISNVQPGQILIGYLLSVSSNAAFFEISADITGRMLAIEFSNFDEIKRLQIGSGVKVKVMEVNAKNQAVELCTAESKKLKQAKIGDIVQGQLEVTHRKNVYLRQRFGRTFFVDLMNLFDFWRVNVLDGLQSGVKVQGKITKIGISKSREKSDTSEVSLRPSDGGWIEGMEYVYNQSESCEQIEEVRNEQLLEAGKCLKGYVETLGGLGVFVRLRVGQSGRVKLGQVSERYVDEQLLKQLYKVGDMVVAKVVKTTKLQPSESPSAPLFQIQMTLKTREETNWLTIKDFNVGDVVKGRVTRVESYGVFIKINKSSVKGLAHITKITDKKLDSGQLQRMFKIDQEVKCMFLSLDKENNKIELSLNSKYFGEEKEDEQIAEDAGNMDVDVEEMMLDEMDVDRDSASQHQHNLQNSRHFIQSPSKKRKVHQDEEEQQSSEESQSDDEVQHRNGQMNGKQRRINPEEESIEIESMSNNTQSDQEADTGDDIDEGSEQSDDNDSDTGIQESDQDEEQDSGDNLQEDVSEFAGGQDNKRGWQGLDILINSDMKGQESDKEEKQEVSKAEKKRQKAERELQIRTKELERLHGEQAPKTSEDYERLIVSSPNSSYVWIQYMAYQISLGESENARKTAERALETINFREEHEKFNVWIAYLNLEYQFGDNRDAFNKLLSRALVHTNQKKLYLAVIDIVQNDHELAMPIFKTMCRKFKESCKVWVRRVQHCMMHKDEDDKVSKQILKILQDARKVLADKKYTKLMIRVALLEFQEGEAERGRGMMEGLLQKFPKRLDLWSQYIDKEIKIGDQQKIRALFERATHLQLPPKKMKFLFKRYLQYEKDYGNEDTVSFVKQQAMEFVEKLKG